MPKYALVHKGETRVQAIANTAEERFDVHEDFVWHQCPDQVERQWDYNWETQEWTPERVAETHYTVCRRIGYGDVGAQLGAIYDAMTSGTNEPFEMWLEHQRLVKLLFPKDNQAAVEAANAELGRRMDEKYAVNENPDLPALTLQLAKDFEAGTWVNPAL